MAPDCFGLLTATGSRSPEVWFRILHVAADGREAATAGAYREQTVEIVLGPQAVFGDGNLGALTRR